MTWQACVRDCSDFYPAADVSHGRGHTSSKATNSFDKQRSAVLGAYARALILARPPLTRCATRRPHWHPCRAPILSSRHLR